MRRRKIAAIYTNYSFMEHLIVPHPHERVDMKPVPMNSIFPTSSKGCKEMCRSIVSVLLGMLEFPLNDLKDSPGIPRFVTMILQQKGSEKLNNTSSCLPSNPCTQSYPRRRLDNHLAGAVAKSPVCRVESDLIRTCGPVDHVLKDFVTETILKVSWCLPDVWKMCQA